MGFLGTSSPLPHSLVGESLSSRQGLYGVLALPSPQSFPPQHMDGSWEYLGRQKVGPSFDQARDVPNQMELLCRPRRLPSGGGGASLGCPPPPALRFSWHVSPVRPGGVRSL